MSWVKLDDGFPDHLKVIGLSDKAFRQHTSALCWAARNLTDGFIPTAALASLRGSKRSAGELVDADLWDLCEEPAGWMIHDFLEFNPSAETVKRKREDAKDRMAAGRAQKRSPDVRANGERSSDHVSSPRSRPGPDPHSQEPRSIKDRAAAS